MKRQRGYITQSDWNFFLGFLICIGVAVGGVLFLGVPWLWRLLKPWLHAITG